MSNFSPKLEDATDDQLKYMVNELDFRVVPLASDELTRRSLKALHETTKELDTEIRDLNKNIKKANKETSKHSTILIRLSFVLFVVAILQLFISVGTLPVSHKTQFLIVLLVASAIGYTIRDIGKGKF